jgi:uncharacterized protein RhaS with RHS repeats
MTRTSDRTVNRYYDPSTDQFLSVDPDVSRTDQPYTYTSDDPLNSEDPTGTDPAELGTADAATVGVAFETAKAKASAAAEKTAVAKLLKYVASEEEILHKENSAQQWALMNDSPGALGLAEKYGEAVGNFATTLSGYVNNVGTAAVSTYGLYSALGDQATAGLAVQTALESYTAAGYGVGAINADAWAAVGGDTAEAALEATSIDVTFSLSDWIVAIIGLFS